MRDILEEVEIRGCIRLLGISFGNLSKNLARQLTFGERSELKKKVDLELLKEKIKSIEKKDSKVI